MEPRHAIAPTIIVRRHGAKKWHISRDQSGEHHGTMCGQSIRMPEESVAYNAEQVSCTDCLVSAISRGDTGRPAYA